MVLESRAHRLVSSVVGGNIGKRHAAQFGGEARTQGDRIHRRASIAHIR
jgi:hypothetical protein